MRFQTILTILAAGLASSASPASAASAKPFHQLSLDPASEIRNVLAHYCIILDTKKYDDLNSVYTPDATANFTTIGLGVLSGLLAIQKAMNSSLFGISSQHAMTTSYIVDIKKNEASTVTYYTLEEFGTGEKVGQLFTVWGKWEDQFVYSEGWRIKNRQVVVMGGPLIGNFVVPSH